MAICALAVVLCGGGLSASTAQEQDTSQLQRWTSDLDALTSGRLDHHSPWFTTRKGTAIKVVAGELEPGSTLKGSSTDVWQSRVRHLLPLALRGGEVLELSFDVRVSGKTSVAVLGLASSLDVNQGPYFGVFAEQGWVVREGKNGKQRSARDAAGRIVRPVPGHWYRVRSTWRISANGEAGDATLEIRDLTANASGFTELRFGERRTPRAGLGLNWESWRGVETADGMQFGSAHNPYMWDQVLLRLQSIRRGQPAYADNLHLRILYPQRARNAADPHKAAP